MFRILMFLVAGLSAAPTLVLADLCYWRPSRLLGDTAAGTLEASSVAAATVGVTAKMAGFYTLTHAASGATMLGSTAGGVSAAGTVGIMGGTGGAIGTVASIVMAPAVIGTSATVAVGGGATEIYCRKAVDQTTGIALFDVLKSAADALPDDEIRLTKFEDDYFFCFGPLEQEGSCHIFSRLYLEDGRIMETMPWAADKLVVELR